MISLQGMTYTRKRLLESQLKLWKGLRDDYTRYRDAEVQAGREWHSYDTVIQDLSNKIRHAELAWKEQK